MESFLRSGLLFKLGIVFFIITTASYYLLFEQRYDIHTVYQVAVTGRKGAFVQGVLQNEVEGPYDGSALAALCSTKTWVPGLIFQCEHPQGGVANVRNVFLNCVRYAIEAGATGFVTPQITVRGPPTKDKPEELTERLVPFTYYFDYDHFATSLQTSCPQMHVYSHRNDLWDKPSTATPVLISHPQLTTPRHPFADRVMLSPTSWSTSFIHHLNNTSFTPTLPLLVSLQNTLLTWPLTHDSPAFVAAFGGILRPCPTIRQLAATIHYAMYKQYQLTIKPKSPGVQQAKFYGAHLRTGVDAARGGWSSYDVQATNYLSQAAEHQLPIIYVSSDSPADTLLLAQAAGNHSFPMEVVTQDSLLGAKEFEGESLQLAELTWEQRILVDWEVLVRASVFGGTWESSFGWGVAMRRHTAVGGGGDWVPLQEPEVGFSGNWTGDVYSDMGTKAGKESHTATSSSMSGLTSSTGMADEGKQLGVAASEQLQAMPEAVADDASEAQGGMQGENPTTSPPPEATPLRMNPDPNTAPKDPSSDTGEPIAVAPSENDVHTDSGPEPNADSNLNSQAEPHNPSDDHAADTMLTKPAAPLPPETHIRKRVSVREDQPDTGHRSRVSKRKLQTSKQAFHDEYSTIFGDVRPDHHPGIIFQLALWP